MLEAHSLLRSATRTLVLTGAGISAESGVPTFRGPDGLWKNHRPEQLATPEAFRTDPRLVWEWYAWRRTLVASCRPNAAHEALARLTLRRKGARIVTQNVDGLHTLALVEAMKDEPPRASLLEPLELHGSIYRVRCVGCTYRSDHRGAIDANRTATLPHCPDCGDLLRPDIVWFGESLNDRVLKAAISEAEGAEICLVVGTSALVQPAASLPLLTREAGGIIIEVNPETTPLSRFAHISLRGSAAELVPALLTVHPDAEELGGPCGRDT